MNAAWTTASKRIDERRRVMLLGAAGASPTHLSGCGGGGGSSMMSLSVSAALVDPAASATTERSLPVVQQDIGLADGRGGRQVALTAQRGSAQLLSGIDTPTQGYNGALPGPALRWRTGE